MENKHWIYQVVDALSLSGAIIVMLFSLTLYGIIQQNEKVWQVFGASLTTFVSGKKLGEGQNKDK